LHHAGRSTGKIVTAAALIFGLLALSSVFKAQAAPAASKYTLQVISSHMPKGYSGPIPVSINIHGTVVGEVFSASGASASHFSRSPLWPQA
jgi:hypothetical protein